MAQGYVGGAVTRNVLCCAGKLTHCTYVTCKKFISNGHPEPHVPEYKIRAIDENLRFRPSNFKTEGALKVGATAHEQ